MSLKVLRFETAARAKVGAVAKATSRSKLYEFVVQLRRMGHVEKAHDRGSHRGSV